MTSGAVKPVIFISYSHKDEPEHPHGEEVQWLSFVRTFLQPAVKHGVFDLWNDQQMPGGADWNPEIEKKLRACDIFILLVSANSMASHYIVDKEIAIIRERQAQNEPVHFYPLLLTPTPQAGLDKVKDKNLRPHDAQPFSGYSLHDRAQHMTDVADEIATLVHQMVQRRSVERPANDFSKPVYVHITGLPETAYERLVGRNIELQRLDHAWVDHNINIISLIAEGGAGKSALVNEWLKRLQARGYGGAEIVLGWSFYNQGTKERATSADEFLDWALTKLGITITAPSPNAKADAIAEAVMKRRVLLLLDGVEPLQHGLDMQSGQLKDLGLRTLLRRFAAAPPEEEHGLIVLTSRLPLKDIQRWKDGAAPVVDIEQLSKEAGAALLRDNSVWGVDKELEAAAHDFGGHPLALALLASFLRETQKGDVRRRDHIRAYFADQDNPLRDHARRVMESYEKEWLTGQPTLLATMYLVGLFDRPAVESCLRALRDKPAIEGLTEQLVEQSETDWHRTISRLREGRLLAPADYSSSNSLDAHPSVREWFGERLKACHMQAWRLGNERLYGFLQIAVKDRKTATLQELAPLYQAIPHGCRSGHHQETLRKIYRDRLSRKQPDGEDTYYTFYHLGAASTDLAAMSWFFDQPFEVPVADLDAFDRQWVLKTSGLYLMSQGRFDEARAALESALKIHQRQEDREQVHRITSLLGNIALSVGDVRRALDIRKKGLEFVIHQNLSKISIATAHSMRIHALLAAGDFEAARRSLVEIRRFNMQLRQRNQFGQTQDGAEPEQCEILIAIGNFAEAYRLARRGVRSSGFASLGMKALIQLQAGRASLGLALCNTPKSNHSFTPEANTHVALARAELDDAVERLRFAGRMDLMPAGYLGRSALRRSFGDWNRASHDLDEVDEITQPGPMRLFLCDAATERARLAFARIEAFAPLNGRLERDNPPAPAVPSADEIAKFKSEAEKQLEVATDYVETCGYHRRDEELAELWAVLRGEKKFADLPPRV